MPVDLPDLVSEGRTAGQVGRERQVLTEPHRWIPHWEKQRPDHQRLKLLFMILSKPPRRILHWKKRRPDQQVPRLSRPPRWILHWKKHRPGQQPVELTNRPQIPHWKKHYPGQHPVGRQEGRPRSP